MGRSFVGLALTLGLCLALGCSSGDDEANAAAGSDAAADTDGGQIPGVSGNSGASGSVAAAGKGGGSGSTTPTAGGGSAGRAGAGSGQGGSSADPADAGTDPPQHFPIAGSGGSKAPADSGLPEDLEGTCSTDADCELCTGPLGVGDACCPGCPLISSKEICAQIRAAMEACPPRGIQLCPQVACLFPGSPKCSPEGKCIMTPGIEQ